jgi:hypothetical protein
VDITGTTPGKGNFPEHPHYLSPVMPWSAWRFMTDAEIKAIAAYLKRGLKPVVTKSRTATARRTSGPAK